MVELHRWHLATEGWWGGVQKRVLIVFPAMFVVVFHLDVLTDLKMVRRVSEPLRSCWIVQREGMF